MPDEQEEERPDLGKFNDKIHYYPKKGSKIAVVQYNDEVWLAYRKAPTDDALHGDYVVIQRSMLKDRRLELGAWLTNVRPSEDDDVLSQFFIDQIEPLPFEEFFDDVEDTPEGSAMFEAMDMAAGVLNEGGGCTECGANLEDDESFYEDGSIRHKRGCRLPSFMMWRMLHQEDQDRTPSMGQVIKAALDQIARMK